MYHCGKRKSASVGALVATINERQSKYYSTVSTHGSREELSSNLCLDITSKSTIFIFILQKIRLKLTKFLFLSCPECLNAFSKTNKDLPERIIMYRDGVGEGQLGFVYETELKQIKVRQFLKCCQIIKLRLLNNSTLFCPDCHGSRVPVCGEEPTQIYLYCGHQEN